MMYVVNGHTHIKTSPTTDNLDNLDDPQASPRSCQSNEEGMWRQSCGAVLRSRSFALSKIMRRRCFF